MYVAHIEKLKRFLKYRNLNKANKAHSSKATPKINLTFFLLHSVANALELEKLMNTTINKSTLLTINTSDSIVSDRTEFWNS